MKLLKATKSQIQQAPDSTSGTLAERLKRAMEDANAFIDQKTAELKASPDGALLPFGVLRQMITKHVRCSCKVALALIDQDKKHG
jgi:hypothetical protein